ncbi:MAG TPA: hypothetical protein VF808_14780, partial [Ktedonobacterales bacterium]
MNSARAPAGNGSRAGAVSAYGRESPGARGVAAGGRVWHNLSKGVAMRRAASEGPYSMAAVTE